MRKHIKSDEVDEGVQIDAVKANIDDQLSVGCEIIVSVATKDADKPKWEKGIVKGFDKSDGSVRVMLEGKTVVQKFSRDELSIPTDSKISYEPESSFASLYKDIYEPESNIIDEILHGKVIKAFNVFLNKHGEDKRFNFLRSIDLNNCLEGDLVILAESSKYVKIIEIDEDYENFVIEINEEIKISVTKSSLKPIDEYITRLKKDDVIFLYEFIKNRVKSVYFDENKYFIIFSDYFKLTNISLFTLLPQDVKRTLVNGIRTKNPRAFNGKEEVLNKFFDQGYW